MRRIAMALLAATLSSGCKTLEEGTFPDDDESGDTADVGLEYCEPGTLVACFCGFLEGEQECIGNGYERGPCMCEEPGSSSSSSTSPTGSTTADTDTTGVGSSTGSSSTGTTTSTTDPASSSSSSVSAG